MEDHPRRLKVPRTTCAELCDVSPITTDTDFARERRAGANAKAKVALVAGL